MSENSMNILEANQQIGELKAQLTTEKEARAAVQSDLEAAKAAHLEEVQGLKDSHATELTTLKGDHAKEVTRLTDQVESVKAELATANEKIGELEAGEKTASKKAVEIVGQTGGEAVEVAEGNATEKKGKATPEELAELYQEQSKIKGAKAKTDFYLQNIKPRLA